MPLLPQNIKLKKPKSSQAEIPYLYISSLSNPKPQKKKKLLLPLNFKRNPKMEKSQNFDFTMGSNCICQTSEGGASRVAMLALVLTSNTRTKLSREAEAAKTPEGWAANDTTPRLWPVLVRSSLSASELQSLTVSSSEPVRRRAERDSVGGTHVTAHTDSSCALSMDFRPASFIWLWRCAVKTRQRNLESRRWGFGDLEGFYLFCAFFNFFYTRRETERWREAQDGASTF